MLVALGVYGGLFAFSFLAATLAPGSSEAALSGLLLAGGWDPVILIASASLGNVAGSVFNWYCGRFLSHYKERSWFPVKEHQYKKAVRWFKRYGQASMLLAWVPIIGDPLTVIAGTLRMKFMNFWCWLLSAKSPDTYLCITQSRLGRDKLLIPSDMQ